IVTARLTEACPINPWQKGFTRAAGYTENLKLLQLLLKNAKREHKEIAVVFMDIAKAFHSVSHQHIVMALRERQVDECVIRLMQNLYDTTYTCIN
ncbi:PO22 protein, partial [Phainopepla nitens]|nr:PO22 protein [Phainopepla nitens]